MQMVWLWSVGSHYAYEMTDAPAWQFTVLSASGSGISVPRRYAAQRSGASSRRSPANSSGRTVPEAGSRRHCRKYDPGLPFLALSLRT